LGHRHDAIDEGQPRKSKSARQVPAHRRRTAVRQFLDERPGTNDEHPIIGTVPQPIAFGWQCTPGRLFSNYDVVGAGHADDRLIVEAG
jgi:hypothetical protein